MGETQTVAKGVKEAGQVLRGTATEVVGQVKEHGQDLQHLRQDLESTVTSYMDPASLYGPAPLCCSSFLRCFRSLHPHLLCLLTTS